MPTTFVCIVSNRNSLQWINASATAMQWIQCIWQAPDIRFQMTMTCRDMRRRISLADNYAYRFKMPKTDFLLYLSTCFLYLFIDIETLIISYPPNRCRNIRVHSGGGLGSVDGRICCDASANNAWHCLLHWRRVSRLGLYLRWRPQVGPFYQ